MRRAVLCSWFGLIGIEMATAPTRDLRDRQRASIDFIACDIGLSRKLPTNGVLREFQPRRSHSAISKCPLQAVGYSTPSSCEMPGGFHRYSLGRALADATSR